MPTSSEIRARARESLQGMWGRSAGQYLLFTLIFSVPLGLISIWNRYVGQIVDLLVSGVLSYGLYSYFLSVARGQKPSFSVFFGGFNRYVSVFLLYLLTAIFTALWSILLIVPGIIAMIRYSQAYYILHDHPDISPLEAIRRSKAMMAGHKWQLFVLALSFIGWILLVMITVGIAILWVNPYLMTAFAHFHQELKDRSMPVPAQVTGNPGLQG
ncbi:MAG: rane protein [Cohnella sp.]|nr:rane protein [Cohnella sp.]